MQDQEIPRRSRQIGRDAERVVRMGGEIMGNEKPSKSGHRKPLGWSLRLLLDCTDHAIGDSVPAADPSQESE
jgi:hypothetical protein